MNIICKIFGHNWDNNPYKQPCKRRNCFVTRWKSILPDGSTDWRITDIDNIKIRYQWNWRYELKFTFNVILTMAFFWLVFYLLGYFFKIK